MWELVDGSPKPGRMETYQGGGQGPLRTVEPQNKTGS
jgi:hypothetical protein